MSTMACQITTVSIVYSTVCSGAYQWKLQSSSSLDFVSGIRRRPVNSPHKGQQMQKIFPFDDVIVPLLDLKHHIQVSRGYAYGLLKYYLGKRDIGDSDCNITV